MFIFLLLFVSSPIPALSDVIEFHVSEIPAPIQKAREMEHPIIPNRLLQPRFNESIAHILINPLILKNKTERRKEEEEQNMLMVLMDKEPSVQEQHGLRELVKVCSDPIQFSDLPFLFPRYLCALSAVYQEQNMPNLNFTRFIYPRNTDAVREMNDWENYPCHSMNMTDVVALIPGRIYRGCVSDTNPDAFSQFDSAFIMTHPFPDARKNCTIHPICELRSMIFQHKILYQHEDCCCEGDLCGMLIFTQTDSLTPLVIKTVDFSQHKMVPLPTSTTKRTTADFSWIFGSGGGRRKQKLGTGTILGGKNKD